jgi:membrane associated rhomboid family serine protease
MPTTYLLIAINVAISLIIFSVMGRPAGMRMAFFSPSEVAAGRGYPGMVLSHFSHADAGHLLFNMVTLYFFGPTVEYYLGTVNMLLIYVAGGVLSTVVVYFRHRAEPEYRALGASDSITAILFAAIVLVPESDVLFFFVPIPIPAPLFAVAYIVISTYFMRRGGGSLSHEAHLAGAFAGLVLAGLLSPLGFGPLLRRFQSFFS